MAVGGQWGTVDIAGWGWTESLVACRSLGYKSECGGAGKLFSGVVLQALVNSAADATARTSVW